MRPSELCEKLAERVFRQIILGDDFMSPILASPLLHGDLCSLWLAETFCKNYVPDCMYLPCIKSHILPSPHPTLFGAVSQSHLKCYLSSYSPHLTPNKTTHNPQIVHFFPVNTCPQASAFAGPSGFSALPKQALQLFWAGDSPDVPILPSLS